MLIHHHTGGLETSEFWVVWLCSIHHHTGGLENTTSNVIILI
ncbi:hypothetical protein [uncultured Gammaproteobacteria bacterium]|nr:hypothetical protein [uncultured Gammaproteobacteria bacterium]CAC9997695.1 hypothetical protein [uncultured Gammaproteobacteria bacterium]CAC9998736.1 hypothetical protein [uncultured Gammaproteobacteria bacterium]VVH58850.1 hypothetical protein BAZOLSSOX_318 [uncultured Gammaproteobacteria bacterium]